MSEREKKDSKHGAEEVRDILDAVSTQVPGLIKSILGSVFSEEAGRNMGKAAAAYYKELKDGGMPEQVAVKMTEDYMRTFTSLGEMLRGMGRGGPGANIGANIGGEVSKAFEKRRHETEKQEEK
jgi:hypothetical protein